MESVLGNLLKENQPQDYIRIIEEENDELYEQIDQLTNNWNELEEFIQKELDNNVDGIKSFGGYQCKIILDKMKEIKDNDKV